MKKQNIINEDKRINKTSNVFLSWQWEIDNGRLKLERQSAAGGKEYVAETHLKVDVSHFGSYYQIRHKIEDSPPYNK